MKFQKLCLGLFLVLYGYSAHSQSKGLAYDHVEFTIRSGWAKPFPEEKIGIEDYFADDFRDSLTVNGIRGKHFLYDDPFGHFRPYNPFKPRDALMQDLLVSGDSVYLMFVTSDYRDTALALFYDFSLQLGDSFLITRTHPQDTAATMHYVVDTGTITFLNGSKHQYLKLSAFQWDTITWIKGIGTLEYGFNMSRQSWFETEYEVKVLCNSNQLLLKKDLHKPEVDSSCHWPGIASIAERSSQTLFELVQPIYEVPTLIYHGHHLPLTVEVYSFSGEMVSREIVHSKGIKLNVKHIDKGLFVLRINDSKGIFTTKKFLK